MSYNEKLYKQYRESRKQERELIGYNKPKERWRTDSVYVDVDTGEIILKRQLETGEYIKLKKIENYEIKENWKNRKITTECRRNQGRLWENNE
jgi:hypothetical protein